VTHIQNLLAQPACHALGWALLHFLWQGTLAGLLFAACNAALRDASARLRYAVGCLFLVLLLALPVLTFTTSLLHSSPPWGAGFSPRGASSPAAAPFSSSAPTPTLQNPVTPLLPWIVVLWTTGVALLSLRWIGAWTVLHRQRRAASLPVPPEWERALRDLMRRAAVSAPVRLSIHRLTQVPCVVGWLRPVILMPAASVAGLDWRALEALLAHELAHIRRHDYLINLLQTTVDTLLFYHPAVWWVSRRIRIERENCCDDLAAQICGDRLVYARALVDLEQIRAAEPAFAMSARGGSLIHRIQRLLRPDAPERRSPTWFPALAGLAAVACMMVALHSPVHAERPQETPVEPAPAAPPAQSHDFLTGIVAAGFRNLTVDELIELKIHGVTPEFAMAVKQAGYANVTAQELIQMSIHGVDVDFMRAMKTNGLTNLSVSDLINLRIHGVTPEYIAELRNAGYANLTADEYEQLRIHGVDAAFIRHLNEKGLKNLSLDQLLRLKLGGGL
jgi:beta-lactamase regulating signal transducer with metallopeptidase domain